MSFLRVHRGLNDSTGLVWREAVQSCQLSPLRICFPRPNSRCPTIKTDLGAQNSTAPFYSTGVKRLTNQLGYSQDDICKKIKDFATRLIFLSHLCINSNNFNRFWEELLILSPLNPFSVPYGLRTGISLLLSLSRDQTGSVMCCTFACESRRCSN